MAGDQLDDYLARLGDDLPTVPHVATRIIEALDDPETSLDGVRVLIERDAALAARILKVSNSSMYSFPTEIQGLGQAVSLVGGRSVRNLVMAVAMRETYKDFGALEKLLWEHSMAAGPAAAALARELGGVDPDEAFMAGLLHDIGKTALANSDRDAYAAVSARVDELVIPSTEAEREEFGFDHAEVGARVGERWQLPPRVIAVIRHHHDPAALGKLAEPEAKLTALVEVTTHCLTRLGAGRTRPVEELDVCGSAGWKHLGVPDGELERLLGLCADQIEAARSFAD